MARRTRLQLRGYARITANPTVLGAVLCAAGFVALRGRNADGLVQWSADGHAGTVVLGEAVRLATLNLGTLVGLAVATAVATAVLPGALGSRGEEMMALYEPVHARRLAFRGLAVTTVLAASLIVAAGLLVAVAAVQLIRAGVTPGMDLGATTAPLWDTLARVAAVLPALAAVGLLIATLVPSNPAIAVATATGGAVAMLILQHLMGRTGDVALPSAWLGRWLHLTSADFEVGYVWTVGSFSSGRGWSGLAVFSVGAAAGAGAWSRIRRAARS